MIIYLLSIIFPSVYHLYLFIYLEGIIYLYSIYILGTSMFTPAPFANLVYYQLFFFSEKWR